MKARVCACSHGNRVLIGQWHGRMMSAVVSEGCSGRHAARLDGPRWVLQRREEQVKGFILFSYSLSLEIVFLRNRGFLSAFAVALANNSALDSSPCRQQHQSFK